MKYTKEQAERLKNKAMDGFTKYDRPLPQITIKDGFYIIESKINLHLIKKVLYLHNNIGQDI